MIATSGRVTALAIGLPLVLGVMGFQAFDMVGLMAQTSEHHEASYPWQGGEIALDISSGGVTVVTGDSNTVGVSYTEHYQLRKPTVSATQVGAGLQLKARCPGVFFSNNCDINYTLTVPSSAKMTIHTGNGGVRIADLTGAARERSGELIPALARQGVLATGLYRLRFVTHLDVDDAGIDRAIAAIRSFFRA